MLRSAMFVVIALGVAGVARAGQLSAIVAPGPLSKAHASLEGLASCAKCHEAGRKSTVERCLSCHKPVAQRIAKKTGVHRAVTECASCHAEHRGADVDLRRVDEQTFDHAAETGFALDGRHAELARKCSACHTTRSFLEVRTTCSPCHADTHKRRLGDDCIRCHSTRTPFKDTRRVFDHNRTPFVLTGAHRTVDCQKCHAGGEFREVRFDMCSACHQPPHRRTLGPACTTCHNTDAWATRTVDHGKTGFTLVGAHAQVACVKCHQTGITKALRSDQCSACHVDVHRESVKQDCRACHDERTFKGATFDHRAKTSFALVGKHDGLECRKCHTTIAIADLPLARKVVDFGGLKTTCVACHEDKEHKGEFGRDCDACHRPTKFSVKDFKHPRAAEFFGDQHAAVPCVKCHVRPPTTPPAVRTVAMVSGPPPPSAQPAAAPSMDCRSCHADVHLGQVGTACEKCHAISAAKFAASRFSHQQVAFTLTGKHTMIDCAKCHPRETRAFPAGTGTATRLNPTASECKGCHTDPHFGQVDAQCKRCHTTASFSIFSYKHTGLSQIFGGLHGSLRCQACHKTETGTFPGGHGTAVRFKVGTTCIECHPRF
jgi:hypothetical protein